MRIQRGKFYALTGQMQRAIHDFRLVLLQNYADIEAHLNLASIYTLTSRYEEAAHHLRVVGCQWNTTEPTVPLSSLAWRN